MIASKRRISAVAFVSIAFAALRCISLQATGGTGDETVIGKVVHEDGSPAGLTVITLRPSDFDPASDLHHGDYGLDTTDNTGRYSISLASPKTRRYTLQAVNLVLHTRTIIPDIDISATGEPVEIATASLHKTGRIKVILSDSSIAGNGHAFIPGTNLYAYMENGYTIIDSVPAETISCVNYGYSNADEINRSHIMAEKVMVKPGILTIVAFSGSANSAKLFLNTTPQGAGITENVLNFPVLVRLTNENFSFGEARTDGSDIRFTKTDDTPLPFEIERWDAAAKQAEIWVKVDTVYGNDSSRCMVMYWGEPATVIPRNTAPPQVFDSASGFRGVWHLAEEAAGVGTKGLYIDAAGHNSGDDFISAAGRSGIIGCGHAFDGIDDYIPVNGPVTNFLQGNLTIALWVNIRDSGGTIMSKRDTSPKWKKGESSFYFGDGTDTNVVPGVNGAYPSFVGFNDDYAIAEQPLAGGGWHYLVYTWEWNGDSTGSPRYFFDGREVALRRDSLTVRLAENVNATLRIGQPNNNESYAYFNGLMDELEISAVAQGAGWIKLSYMNQRPGNFLVKR